MAGFALYVTQRNFNSNDSDSIQISWHAVNQVCCVVSYQQVQYQQVSYQIEIELTNFVVYYTSRFNILLLDPGAQFPWNPQCQIHYRNVFQFRTLIKTRANFGIKTFSLIGDIVVVGIGVQGPPRGDGVHIQSPWRGGVRGC